MEKNISFYNISNIKSDYKLFKSIYKISLPFVIISLLILIIQFFLSYYNFYGDYNKLFRAFNFFLPFFLIPAIAFFFFTVVIKYFVVLKLWLKLPKTYNNIALKKIIWGVFIPIFNIYWIYVFFRKLAIQFNTYASSLKNKEIEIIQLNICTIASVIWMMMFFIIPVPFVAIFAYVVNYIFFKQIIKAHIFIIDNN